MDSSAQVELVRRCQRGDSAAWEELVSAFYAEVGRFIFLLNPAYAETEVEEVAAGVFLDSVRAVAFFGGRNPARVGLFYAALRKAATHHPRRESRVQNPPQPAGGGNPNGRSGPPAHLALFLALDHLGGPCRDLIVLRYFGNLELADLAPEFEVSEATLAIRIAKCLGTLGGLMALEAPGGDRQAAEEAEDGASAELITAALLSYREWRLGQLPPSLQPPDSLLPQIRAALTRSPEARSRVELRRAARFVKPDIVAKAIGAAAGVVTVATGIALVASRTGRDAGAGGGSAHDNRMTGLGLSTITPPGQETSLNRGTEREFEEFVSRLLPVNPLPSPAPIAAGASTVNTSAPEPTEPSSAGASLTSPSPSAPTDAKLQVAKDPSRSAEAPLSNSSAATPTLTTGRVTSNGDPTAPSGSEASGLTVTASGGAGSSQPPWTAEQAEGMAPAWMLRGSGPVARAAMELRTFAHYGATPLLENVPATFGRALNSPAFPFGQSDAQVAGGATNVPAVPSAPRKPEPMPLSAGDQLAATKAEPATGPVGDSLAAAVDGVVSAAGRQPDSGGSPAVGTGVAEFSNQTDWTVEVVAARPSAGAAEVAPPELTAASSAATAAAVSSIGEAAQSGDSGLASSQARTDVEIARQPLAPKTDRNVETPEQLAATAAAESNLPQENSLVDDSVPKTAPPDSIATAVEPVRRQEASSQAFQMQLVAVPGSNNGGKREQSTDSDASPLARADTRSKVDSDSEVAFSTSAPSEAEAKPAGGLASRPLIGLNLNFRVHLGGKPVGTVGISGSRPFAEPSVADSRNPTSGETGVSEGVTLAPASAPKPMPIAGRAENWNRRVTPLHPLAERTHASRPAPIASAYRSSDRPYQANQPPVLRVASVRPAAGTANDFLSTDPDEKALAAVNSGMLPETGSASAKFVREEITRSLRRNLNSPPMPQVLEEFRFADRAGRLVLLDSDGSEFPVVSESGEEAFASLASLARTLRTFGLPLRFSASGLSLSTGEIVTFEGWVEPEDDSVSEVPRTASEGGPEVLAAAQVRGEVQVGARQRFPISATSGRD